MYCLYCHTNKTNGKRYFGITRTAPKRRWAAGHGYQSSRHFNFAIQKYGWDGFDHEIIADNLTKEQACAMERDYIARFKTTDARFGYNLSEGGQSGAAGIVQSEETRAKKSAKLKGRTFTEEHRRKLSEAAKGRKFTEEHKANLSKARKGRKLTHEQKARISRANKGRKLTEEQREKIRESKRGMMRPVYCTETDMTYESVSAAARALGVSRSNLASTCKGKHEHVGGYHVRYAELL